MAHIHYFSRIFTNLIGGLCFMIYLLLLHDPLFSTSSLLPSSLAYPFYTLLHPLLRPSGRPLVKPKLADINPKLICSKNASASTSSPSQILQSNRTAPNQISQSNRTAPNQSGFRRLLYAPLPCTTFGSVITHHGRPRHSMR